MIDRETAKQWAAAAGFRILKIDAGHWVQYADPDEIQALIQRAMNEASKPVAELEALVAELLATLIDLNENAKSDSPEMWARVEAVIEKALAHKVE